MGTEWLKYAAYGIILGAMSQKIWKRTHEESRISLRQEFMPDSSEQVPPPLPPEYSYQDIRPVGYAKPTVASSPSRAYFNGRTYQSVSEMLQAMEIHALEGGHQAEQNNHVIIVTRNN